jgi:hypothetical protein
VSAAHRNDVTYLFRAICFMQLRLESATYSLQDSQHVSKVCCDVANVLRYLRGRYLKWCQTLDCIVQFEAELVKLITRLLSLPSVIKNF